VVASNLQSIRRSRGWSQVEFGLRLESVLGRSVWQAQVSAWETQRSHLRIDHLAAFATALEVPSIELLRYTGPTSLPPLLASTDEAMPLYANTDELVLEVWRRLDRVAQPGE
jgi:transcriptional regulator with XRE-family HTH domain